METVPNKVILTDPLGNQLNLSITKAPGDAYFTDGWTHLGEFYGLQDGGWLTMFYTSLGNFNIEVTTILKDKITYPSMPEPVETNDYANPILLEDDEDDMEDAEPIPLIVDRSKFITAVKKWLSFDEITGLNLVNTFHKSHYIIYIFFPSFYSPYVFV